MDEFFEILIFVIIIIANIVGGIIKIKKKSAEKKFTAPNTNNETEYYENEFTENEYFNDEISASDALSSIRNIPFPETTAANAPCPDCPPCKNDSVSTVQTLEVIENDDDRSEAFNYGEFMQTHGREAFVLAEIILPANSRQGS